MPDAAPTIQIDSTAEKSYVLQIQDQFRDLIRRKQLRPGEKLPSFRQLSRDCGVSLGTVKQAINTLTAEGYVRSHPGRGVFVAEPQLKRKHIALVLPTLENESIAQIMKGVKSGLATGSHRLIVQAADLDFDQELDLFGNLDPSFIAGAVIYPPPMASYVGQLRDLAARGVPYVLVNTCFEELDADAVVADSFEVGRLAMAHLLEAGHRRIGLVDHTGDSLTHRLTRQGMAEALGAAGLSLNDLPRVRLSVSDLSDTDPWANGREATLRLIDAHPDVTALVGINEAISLGALQAIQTSGRSVPDDISLLALGELQAFDLVTPRVTRIRLPQHRMGHDAAERLSRKLAGMSAEVAEPTVRRLPPELIVRDSVGPPAAG